ncbi:dipeptide/oligopeptide/nickel ABC transporter ATP-binding protein [Spirochaetia bacterium]|nr:dipeptide/oligopeptide/nickel ABC transporter ATP-binding protein [Spirochaetia bacterium]
MDKDTLVEVQDLKTYFFTDEGVVKAVDGVDFSIKKGKTLCVVGESGCGKSITARSIMRLIDPPGRIVEGSIKYVNGEGVEIDLTALSPKGQEIRKIRGMEISMIFQEPMSSLSPVHTIGEQIRESIRLHLGLSKEAAKERTIEVLKEVGIPKAEERYDNYPFQLSGGMRQRVMIAMALACKSRLLIADEPTTALDVTTQANILDLIQGLQKEYEMSVMFITHDLGVVAEIADDAVVMYLGKVVERGPVDAIFHDPKHPYLISLLRSIPQLTAGKMERLDSIRGMVPHPFNRPSGCPFHPRCDRAIKGRCDAAAPPRVILGPGREVSCFLYEEGRS